MRLCSNCWNLNQDRELVGLVVARPRHIMLLCQEQGYGRLLPLSRLTIVSNCDCMHMPISTGRPYAAPRRSLLQAVRLAVLPRRCNMSWLAPKYCAQACAERAAFFQVRLSGQVHGAAAGRCQGQSRRGRRRSSARRERSGGRRRCRRSRRSCGCGATDRCRSGCRGRRGLCQNYSPG